MRKEDADKLQDIISEPTNGVNLDLNPRTGDLKWGCVHCGAVSLTFSDKCIGGGVFPGCKNIKNEVVEELTAALEEKKEKNILMNCNYRAGDALIQFCSFIVALALTIRLGIVEHMGWFVVSGVMSLVMASAAVLNQKSRNKEAIQAIRNQRQAALGVPIDEA